MGMVAYYKILTNAELQKITVQPDQVEDILFPADIADPFEGQVNLDKSWHVLHFVLSGGDQSDGTVLGDVVLGGDEIGPDMDYGPARLISPDRVKEIDGALKSVVLVELFQSIDTSSAVLSEIYLGDTIEEEGVEALQGFYDELRSMYAEAAMSSSAVLAYLA